MVFEDITRKKDVMSAITIYYRYVPTTKCLANETKFFC